MLRTNINSKLAWIILGVLVVGTIYLVGEEYKLTKKEINDLIQKEAVNSQRMAREISRERVLYTIDKGDGNVSTYQIVPSENSTVFFY